jgi:8-oxo-dGTP pyrophosphatase MutT (NUDIX family)
LDDVLERITKHISIQEPTPRGLRFAAVSIIISDEETPRVLLIRRAEKEGDPWSGQVAFPGGKRQEGDATAKDTAIRETNEEVGIDLGESASFLGYAPVTMTQTGTMVVVPSVFLLTRQVEVTPNEEVASYLWADLHGILSPEARSTYRVEYGGDDVELPAYAVGEYVIWGLTHRILSSVLAD